MASNTIRRVLKVDLQLLEQKLQEARDERLIFLTEAELTKKTHEEDKQGFEVEMRNTFTSMNEKISELKTLHLEEINKLTEEHNKAMIAINA